MIVNTPVHLLYGDIRLTGNAGAFIAACIWFVEYARRGSLYDFIRSTREPNAFTQILQWAKDVALGKTVFILL